MPESELTQLRRKRRRAVAELTKWEARAARYRSKLERIDARLQELDPRLGLQPDATRTPSRIFKRGELARMVREVLRDAKGPLPTGVIVRECLTAKGVTLPGPGTLKATHRAIRLALWHQEKRGLVVRVGRGNGMRRGLTKLDL